MTKRLTKIMVLGIAGLAFTVVVSITNQKKKSETNNYQDEYQEEAYPIGKQIEEVE